MLDHGAVAPFIQNLPATAKSAVFLGGKKKNKRRQIQAYIFLIAN
jgi:hypothetical protein